MTKYSNIVKKNLLEKEKSQRKTMSTQEFEI